MDKIEIKIAQTMASVFAIPCEQITQETTQRNIETWDSLKHLDLIVALEEEFNITFPIEEIGNLTIFSLIAMIIKEQLQNDNYSN